MSRLFNKTKNIFLAQHLEEAKSFASRSKGLLGRSDLAIGHALWIHSCSSIHTFFMKFSIDVIFVDQKMNVTAIYPNVKPWRIVWPWRGADSVVEMRAGQVSPQLIEKGDSLDVRD